MQFKTILAATLSLFTLTSARIIGIAVPETIAPGQGFNAIIMVENYIQSVYDVAIAFGVSPGEGHEGTIGTVLGSYYLGPGQSNTLTNITKWVDVPSTVAKGPVTLGAGLFSLYGVSSTTTLSNYDVSIAVGDSTSTTYKSSLSS